MRYRIDVKLTGFEEVVVDAENEDQACAKALDRFWEIHTGAKDLRWKSTELTVLSEDS